MILVKRNVKEVKKKHIGTAKARMNESRSFSFCFALTYFTIRRIYSKVLLEGY